MKYIINTAFVLLLSASFACVAEAQQRPERNPFLSADIYRVTHVNPGQQNSIPYRVPLKTQHIDLESLVPVWGGPVNNDTYASTTPGYFWSVATDRVALIDAQGTTGKWLRTLTFLAHSGDLWIHLIRSSNTHTVI